MKKTLLTALAFLPLALMAQRLEVMASGGQYLARGGISINATIGEVCVGAPSGAGLSGTEGFQQGFKTAESLQTTVDREEFSPEIQAQLYPNPAIDQVQVSLQHTADQPVRLQLYNSQGLLIQETETAGALHTFELSSLAAGQYWISLQPAGAKPALMLPFSKISR